ncbi:hypothetical protein F4604DRAFT_1940109 [Suillus subluteus]|nr:hypothetical protein F4604DRAFT_1940109 [Suillus subluteus]
MDSEVTAHGSTIYLIDKCINMLPALLGTNLCSLRPHAELLHSQLSGNAEIVNICFTKSAIAPKAAFECGEAQLQEDDLKLNDKLCKASDY